MTTATTAAALYETDNGEIACRKHLGAAARYTGVDISGQPIVCLTDSDLAQLTALIGSPVQCETCAAIARRAA